MMQVIILSSSQQVQALTIITFFSMVSAVHQQSREIGARPINCSIIITLVEWAIMLLQAVIPTH